MEIPFNIDSSKIKLSINKAEKAFKDLDDAFGILKTHKISLYIMKNNDVMNLTDQQLKDIEHYSELLLSPTEIAIILEIDETAFIEEIFEKKESDVYKAFQRGFLKQKVKIREHLIQTSTESDNAFNQVIKLLDEYNSLIHSEYAKRST